MILPRRGEYHTHLVSISTVRLMYCNSGMVRSEIRRRVRKAKVNVLTYYCFLAMNWCIGCIESRGSQWLLSTDTNLSGGETCCTVPDRIHAISQTIFNTTSMRYFPNHPHEREILQTCNMHHTSFHNLETTKDLPGSTSPYITPMLLIPSDVLVGLHICGHR